MPHHPLTLRCVLETDNVLTYTYRSATAHCAQIGIRACHSDQPHKAAALLCSAAMRVELSRRLPSGRGYGSERAVQRAAPPSAVGRVSAIEQGAPAAAAPLACPLRATPTWEKGQITSTVTTLRITRAARKPMRRGRAAKECRAPGKGTDVGKGRRVHCTITMQL